MSKVYDDTIRALGYLADHPDSPASVIARQVGIADDRYLFRILTGISMDGLCSRRKEGGRYLWRICGDGLLLLGRAVPGR